MKAKFRTEPSKYTQDSMMMCATCRIEYKISEIAKHKCPAWKPRRQPYYKVKKEN